jgi:hypothetical protein
VLPTSTQEILPPTSTQEIQPPTSTQEIQPPTSIQEILPPTSTQEIQPPTSTQESIQPLTQPILQPNDLSQLATNLIQKMFATNQALFSVLKHMTDNELDATKKAELEKQMSLTQTIESQLKSEFNGIKFASDDHFIQNLLSAELGTTSLGALGIGALAFLGGNHKQMGGKIPKKQHKKTKRRLFPKGMW